MGDTLSVIRTPASPVPNNDRGQHRLLQTPIHSSTNGSGSSSSTSNRNTHHTNSAILQRETGIAIRNRLNVTQLEVQSQLAQNSATSSVTQALDALTAANKSQQQQVTYRSVAHEHTSMLASKVGNQIASSVVDNSRPHDASSNINNNDTALTTAAVGGTITSQPAGGISATSAAGDSNVSSLELPAVTPPSANESASIQSLFDAFTSQPLTSGSSELPTGYATDDSDPFDSFMVVVMGANPATVDMAVAIIQEGMAAGAAKASVALPSAFINTLRIPGPKFGDAIGLDPTDNYYMLMLRNILPPGRPSHNIFTSYVASQPLQVWRLTPSTASPQQQLLGGLAEAQMYPDLARFWNPTPPGPPVYPLPTVASRQVPGDLHPLTTSTVDGSAARTGHSLTSMPTLVSAYSQAPLPDTQQDKLLDTTMLSSQPTANHHASNTNSSSNSNILQMFFNYLGSRSAVEYNNTALNANDSAVITSSSMGPLANDITLAVQQHLTANTLMSQQLGPRGELDMSNQQDNSTGNATDTTNSILVTAADGHPDPYSSLNSTVMTGSNEPKLAQPPNAAHPSISLNQPLDEHRFQSAYDYLIGRLSFTFAPQYAIAHSLGSASALELMGLDWGLDCLEKMVDFCNGAVCAVLSVCFSVVDAAVLCLLVSTLHLSVETPPLDITTLSAVQTVEVTMCILTMLTVCVGDNRDAQYMTSFPFVTLARRDQRLLLVGLNHVATGRGYEQGS